MWEVVSMLAHAPQQPSHVTASVGDRALHWSWYLFLLSYPWHLVGGGIAIWVTSLAGGDFTAGEGVPGYVYPALYLWMMTPLVASIVLAVMAWAKGRRPAAIAPALASAVMIVVISVFGAEQFFGI
jgi:hypothetical protein